MGGVAVYSQNGHGASLSNLANGANMLGLKEKRCTSYRNRDHSSWKTDVRSICCR